MFIEFYSLYSGKNKQDFVLLLLRLIEIGFSGSDLFSIFSINLSDHMANFFNAASMNGCAENLLRYCSIRFGGSVKYSLLSITCFM